MSFLQPSKKLPVSLCAGDSCKWVECIGCSCRCGSGKSVDLTVPAVRLYAAFLFQPRLCVEAKKVLIGPDWEIVGPEDLPEEIPDGFRQCWLFELCRSDTVNVRPGSYAWSLFAECGGERATLCRERCLQLAASVCDEPEPSHARKVRDHLRAMLEGLTDSRDGIREVETIDGESFSYSSVGDVERLLRRYERLVRREEDRERISRGQDPNLIKVQF